jgi:hypothetical protein
VDYRLICRDLQRLSYIVLIKHYFFEVE